MNRSWGRRTWSLLDNLEADARAGRDLHRRLLDALDPDHDAPIGRFLRRSRRGQGARFHPRPDQEPLRPIDPETSSKYLMHDRSRGIPQPRPWRANHDRRF